MSYLGRWVLAGLLLAAVGGAATAASESGQGSGTLPRLTVSENNRYLVTEKGDPVFLNADTAWGLARELKREDVAAYLKRRREQHYNAILVSVFGINETAYGRNLFEMGKDGKPDPTRPIVTPGANPASEKEYDAWDHVDYCVDQAAKEGFYVLFLPTWGTNVTGSYDGRNEKARFFDTKNAYTYGRFVGDRYKGRSNVIFIIGGDVRAVYEHHDFSDIFRAMAKGVVAGVNGKDPAGPADYASTFMSYHPPKSSVQSSGWFHNDPWLDFNSIQEWPEAQIEATLRDWAMTPVKPTWLMEGRYEQYYKNKYKAEQWGPWQVRYQAYQTVFSGGCGHTYGNELTYGFGRPDAKEPRPAGTWQEHLEDPGAVQMQHLAALMTRWTKAQYLARVPDQALLDGDTGKAERLKSDRLTATRGADGDYAMVYSANGRPIRVVMSRLAGPRMNASWFSPRTGQWNVGGKEQAEAKPFAEGIPSGAGASVHEFVPPGAAGDGNDWVLVLSR